MATEYQLLFKSDFLCIHINVINILRLLCSIHLYSPLLIFWKHCLIFWHKYVCTLITFGENTFCKQSLIYKYHLRYLTRPDISTYIKFIISELWTPNLRHLTRPLHASSVTHMWFTLIFRACVLKSWFKTMQYALMQQYYH